jgi:hypothetical protein
MQQYCGSQSTLKCHQMGPYYSKIDCVKKILICFLKLIFIVLLCELCLVRVIVLVYIYLELHPLQSCKSLTFLEVYICLDT